jgi:hypothetical protein
MKTKQPQNLLCVPIHQNYWRLIKVRFSTQSYYVIPPIVHRELSGKIKQKTSIQENPEERDSVCIPLKVRIE